MPKCFRAKDPLVTAMRLPAIDDDVDDELFDFLDGAEYLSEHDGALLLLSDAGDLEAEPGDWIVRDSTGRFFPMAHVDFIRAYGAV